MSEPLPAQRRRARAKQLAGWGAVVFLFALSFRYRVHTFESRYQILLFGGLSALVESGLASFYGRRMNWPRVAIGAMAAVLAVVSVKWSLEGLPPFARLWSHAITG